METKTTIISKGIEDLPQSASALIDELEYPLVLFIGELGAGKTTLIKEILSQMGSKDAGSSPSYSIINEYKLDDQAKLYHLDLYRLNTVEEAFALGLEDVIYSGHYCMVEWPQIVIDYLEPPYHVIQITQTEEGSREIILSNKQSRDLNL